MRTPNVTERISRFRTSSLPPEALDRVLENFPQPKSKLEWVRFDNEEEKKLAFPTADKMPQQVRDVLFFLNSQTALTFLERLTGIQGLLPDPYYVGGGLHQIEPGGHLAVHADFNKYEKFDLDRRLNLLLYLNKDWKEEYGGHLELWDTSMSRCVQRVLPLFNRCVVFSTTSNSYHGHPVPLTCPEGRTRKSLATYYYTNGRPVEEQAESHSTVWQKRPDEGLQPVRLAKKVIRSFVPPVVNDAVRFIKSRIGPNGT
jgi:Rps23 Pro-64 3,4-dihydroxylase Tpa1-like proline 4-hydroxylase